VGEDEEQRRMKVRGILLIKVELTPETISRVVECMDFVYPEGFSIKGIKSEGKAYQKAKNDDKNFFSLHIAHINS
jgi:hypothetical protein